MFRIVIADADNSMRRRLVQALVTERGLDVVGTARDRSTALDLVCRTKPELVFVALDMPHHGGLVLIRAIKRALPDTVVVIRPAEAGPVTVQEAFGAGAGGFLLEDGLDEHITSCIRILTPGQVQDFAPADSLPPTHAVRQRRNRAAHGLPRRADAWMSSAHDLHRQRHREHGRRTCDRVMRHERRHR